MERSKGASDADVESRFGMVAVIPKGSRSVIAQTGSTLANHRSQGWAALRRGE
jgi:hypothetical protein